jgi:hypothetical protein
MAALLLYYVLWYYAAAGIIIMRTRAIDDIIKKLKLKNIKIKYIK